MQIPKLHSDGVWSLLTELARRSTRTAVAVPYFGSGASSLLPLKQGDTLVVRFDLEAIKCGQVNPLEVVKLINRGVDVHACANLHAKVFVFGNTALVGSTNVSSSSANDLKEACVEITNRRFAAQCRRFVESLTGERVGIDFAKAMAKFYRPPKFTGRRRKVSRKRREILPRHSEMWLAALVTGRWKDVDEAQEEAGWEKAEKALTNRRRSEIETFSWHGSGLLQKVRPGQRVLQGVKEDDGRIYYSPPGRVLSIRRYMVKGKRKGIIYLEIPKGKRRRAQKPFLKSLGSAAKSLGNPYRTKLLRDPEILYAIGRVFS